MRTVCRGILLISTSSKTLLKKDIEVLKYIIKNHKAPESSEMTISASVHDLEDVGWKTAQSTGAFSYMPYSEVQEYAEIYSGQNQLNTAEQQATRDAIRGIALIANDEKNDPDPTRGHAEAAREKIQILRGQLSLVESVMQSLRDEYKKFLSAHPKEPA